MIQLNSENIKSLTKAMSLALSGLGFDAMASDVLSEEKHSQLKKYASVIVNNLSGSKRERMVGYFKLLGIV